MKKGIILSGLFLLCFSMGCSSVSPRTSQPLMSPSESPEEVHTAIDNVLQAVSGQEVDQKRLQEEMQKDPEAQKALQSIAQGMSAEGPAVKYCPVDGKRFSSKFETCPEHGVGLKDITE